MESNQESNEDLVICHGIHESTLHATSLSAHNDNNDTHNDITKQPTHNTSQHNAAALRDPDALRDSGLLYQGTGHPASRRGPLMIIKEPAGWPEGSNLAAL